jgi:hypothetical protein
MQPKWKCIGHVGDVDPVEHGGGIVYTDETGVYPPEAVFFLEFGDNQVQEARVILEKDPTKEWWYPNVNTIGAFAGWEGNDIHQFFGTHSDKNPFIMATLYYDLVCYYGVENFDPDATVISKSGARRKYSEELDWIRRSVYGKKQQ